MSSTPEVLVEVTRGPLVESRHRGYLVVVDGSGRLLAHVSDPEEEIYARSAAKPFQALPLLTSGAADRFGLYEHEIALVCGSHGGEPMHTQSVHTLLERAGLTEEALRCGEHDPYDPWASTALQAQGKSPTPIYNTCSGKHAGMLLLARHLGASVEGYTEADHPVQRQILEHLARLSAKDPEAFPTATDGCSVPTYAMPIVELARLFGRLVHPVGLDDELNEACRRIVRAMTAHPEMISGSARGLSLDTALMQAGKGKIVAKLGAEGLFTAGVLPDGARFPDGLGIALKVEDGDEGHRVRGPVVMALFERLGLVAADDPLLAPYTPEPVKSRRGEVVGEIRPAFELVWTEAAEGRSPELRTNGARLRNA